MSDSELEEVKTFWPNGELWTHYFRINEKILHGECKKYFYNGVLRKHCFYKNGEQHGEFKRYFQNGEIEIHCFFKDGNIHGVHKWYVERYGIREICDFIDGKRHGECITFHWSGELCAHCFFKEDMKHGEFKSYHQSGELRTHVFFNDGFPEEISDYIEDPDNITDDEFMNLAFIFGDNFFGTESSTGTAS